MTVLLVYIIHMFEMEAIYSQIRLKNLFFINPDYILGEQQEVSKRNIVTVVDNYALIAVKPTCPVLPVRIEGDSFIVKPEQIEIGHAYSFTYLGKKYFIHRPEKNVLELYEVVD